MSDRDHADLGLRTALHDRVRHEHPDLNRLTSHAVVAGHRIRRRRQAGSSLAAVAGVAAVAVLGVQVAGGTTPSSNAPTYVSPASESPVVDPPTGNPADGRTEDLVVTLADLQRLSDVLRQIERPRPGDRSRVEQLRPLERVPDLAPGEAGHSRQDRVKALVALLDASRVQQKKHPSRRSD